jgi:hypothetical protein
MEVSTKNNINIEKAFSEMARLILKRLHWIWLMCHKAASKSLEATNRQIVWIACRTRQTVSVSSVSYLKKKKELSTFFVVIAFSLLVRLTVVDSIDFLFFFLSPFKQARVCVIYIFFFFSTVLDKSI